MFDASFESNPIDSVTPPPVPPKKLRLSPNLFFLVPILLGLIYIGYSVHKDAAAIGEPLAMGAFLFLGLALVIAFGFEFVNGFHDTANAVATVIYTHSMPPLFAVIWSGVFNFLGVLASTGAVAYGIVLLLPVELILQVGTGAGYAMIFALLISAIIWNLGTWMLGIPNSSSHALIGSIMGVGLANQLMTSAVNATSGIDWAQAAKVGKALIFSPLIGFIAAALLLLAMKTLIRNPKLYEAPKDQAPPPFWIRTTLIAACTGVSFAHGGNDGQKGMGLIMIILIGVAPATYALNRALPDTAQPAYVASLDASEQAFVVHAHGASVPTLDIARSAVNAAVRNRRIDTPDIYGALAMMTGNIETQIKVHGALSKVPSADMPQLRNDMYLVNGAVSILKADKNAKAKPDTKALSGLQTTLNDMTRYVPTWVKIATALALGLGTMVGWKRIVVTVGEKIGKSHMTYGQGAAAGLVAAVTIYAAERLGLPVSTTHILSGGVAGTMTANRSGLQWSTIRGIAMAWVLTLPATIVLSGLLYFILRQVL
ncbi:Low-affinity inorganic phosphate transporter 1 [Asticcacaulis sp. MM231]|uniref:inorganic phosphate transporter n=1 Tax=Asticcacaulis sp. MM231 TaxID=3157666 RepID=UPI0032D583D2